MVFLNQLFAAIGSICLLSVLINHVELEAYECCLISFGIALIVGAISCEKD